MTGEFVFFLVLGAAAGGLINGLAGFGTALFALGFWLQIMPPLQAVSIAVVLSVASGLQGIWLVRHQIHSNPQRMARFVVPGIVGIPIGIAILAYIEPTALKLSIGALMLIYGGFFSLRSTLPKLEHPAPIMDASTGFAGGILGGAASLSGALPTMWCAMKPWSKTEIRAVTQPFNVTVLSLTMLTFAIQGAYTIDVLKQIGIALPVTILAAQVGIYGFKRLADVAFRRLLIILMFASGLALMARELIW